MFFADTNVQLLKLIIMITFTNNIIGMYDYKSRDTHTYHVEVRQGNCDGIHIWIDEEDNAHLFNFIADAEHIRNMIKDNVDAFENCENIKFNIFDKGAVRQAEYACKMGHKVEIFYKKF